MTNPIKFLWQVFGLVAAVFAFSSIGMAYTGQCNRAFDAAVERPLHVGKPSVTCPGGLDQAGNSGRYFRTRLRGCWVGEANSQTFGTNCVVTVEAKQSIPTGVEAQGCYVDSVKVLDGPAHCVALFHLATGY